MADTSDIELINFELIKPALAQLTDLLTITTSWVNQYYNIFLNTTPIDNIEIKVYGASGNIETITIPNLSYLRQICTIGTGNPEGSIEAPVGALYLNTQTGIEPELYIKTGELVTPVTNTGWLQLSTVTDVENALQQLEEYQAQVKSLISSNMLTVVNRVFPDYVNGDNTSYAEVNTRHTLTQTGWLELSNSTTPITVTLYYFNGTGEPDTEITKTVGNYALLPLVSGTIFKVTTADTNIVFYPVLYTGD